MAAGRRSRFIARQGFRRKLYLFHFDRFGKDVRPPMLLPEADPRHAVTRLCLSLGGNAVEKLDDDGYFARRLLSAPKVRTLFDVEDAPWPPRAWHCYDNALRALGSVPDGRLHIGLALHRRGWVGHSWIVRPNGKVVEATSVARLYFGVSLDTDEDERRWDQALTWGTEAPEGVKSNG